MAAKPSASQPNTDLSTADCWTEFVTSFASLIGKEPKSVAVALETLVDAGQEGVHLLLDEESTSFDDVRAAFPDVKVPKLRQALNKHRQTTELQPRFAALPSVPNDGSLLEGLKCATTLQPDESTIMTAVAAALAHRVGFYQIPDKLLKAMESYADQSDVPVDDQFMHITDLITRRDYAPIFAAIGGQQGERWITADRKAAFLRKLDDTLWRPLVQFNQRLGAWGDAWQKSAAQIAILLGNAGALSKTGTCSAIPPVQTPPTEGLRDAAEDVVSAINAVFAGTGVLASRALWYEAVRIKEVLDNADLPDVLCYASRDAMLKDLNICAPADYRRLEPDLKQYVLSVIKFSSAVPAGTSNNLRDELEFLGSLVTLSSRIPWDKLQKKS